jgi:hypothetical protein
LETLEFFFTEFLIPEEEVAEGLLESRDTLLIDG